MIVQLEICCRRDVPCRRSRLRLGAGRGWARGKSESGFHRGQAREYILVSLGLLGAGREGWLEGDHFILRCCLNYWLVIRLVKSFLWLLNNLPTIKHLAGRSNCILLELCVMQILHFLGFILSSKTLVIILSRVYIDFLKFIHHLLILFMNYFIHLFPQP